MPHGLDVIYTTLLCIFMVTGVVPSCNENSNSTMQVARMCKNSVVNGTRVFIDAGSNTLSSGVPCTCTVTTLVGKVMEVTLKFNGTLNGICGTTIEFTGQGISNGTESHSCNDATFNVTTNTNRTMNVELRKTQAAYCVSLDLHCGEDKFHCNSGTCIPLNNMCDSNPDCSDGSDEKYCENGNAHCTEGQIPCPSGIGCMGSADKCNNVSDCADKSDEVNCTSGVDVKNATESGQHEQSTPLITVTCTESKIVAQTTTAPTTTTTISPPTTTTGPTETITGMTDASVSSPDQTLLVIFAVVVCICVSALVALCACSKKIEDNKKKRDKGKVDKFGRQL